MPQSTRRWISEKVQSLRESNVLPFHDILDADMVEAALAEEGVTFNELHLHPPGDPLRVPLPGARPRPLLPRGGRAADRLAGDQPPQALRPGDQQLLRGTPAAPAGGRRPAGPPDRPGDRRSRAPTPGSGRAGASRWSTAPPPRCPTPRRTRRRSRSRRPKGSGWGSRWSGWSRSSRWPPGSCATWRSGPYKGKETGETALFRTLLGRPRGGRDRAGGPLFRLVLRDRGAVAAGRRRPVPDAPAAEVRLPPGAAAGGRGPRRDLGQAGAARLDGRGDVCSDARRAGGARAAGARSSSPASGSTSWCW